MSAHHHDRSAPDFPTLPLESLGLDGMETGMLAVLRHFLAAFTDPETQAWQHAFTISTQRWGEARGPQIALGLLSVLEALRRVRVSDLRFNAALCPDCRLHVTPEEAALMRMIHAMRRDDTDAARHAVLELGEGVMDARLIQAALALANRCPAEGANPLGSAPARAPSASSAPVRPSARVLRLVH